MKILSDLTGNFFELKDNEVGIVGESESIQHSVEAIVSLIKGSKHSNVYAHLEKMRPVPIGDLGLREKK